jgi:hypothetical protein
MSTSIINKVAESGIISIDLEKYYPTEEFVTFDLKDYLFMGLILKEKDFRQALKEIDLAQFSNRICFITCSADAIIPMWAYMLACATLQQVSHNVIMGNRELAEKELLLENIRNIDPNDYADKRVVVKGCGEKPVPAEAYMEITKKLLPVVQSIMYGEPCSTVPVYKRKV